MELAACASVSLTQKQRDVLKSSLDSLGSYFEAGGSRVGLEKAFLDGTPELRRLYQVLSLYSLSTDTLIKDFVTSQTEQSVNPDIQYS